MYDKNTIAKIPYVSNRLSNECFILHVTSSFSECVEGAKMWALCKYFSRNALQCRHYGGSI